MSEPNDVSLTAFSQQSPLRFIYPFMPKASSGGPGFNPRQTDFERGSTGKLLSPSRRRHCIDRVCEALGVSERRACQTLGQHRSTQRKTPCGQPDEELLTEDIIELARIIMESQAGLRLVSMKARRLSVSSAQLLPPYF